MNSVKPADLAEPQWQLLQYVSQYAAPFYVAFIYQEYCRPEENYINFCRMFYRLVALCYIEMSGFEVMETGSKQTIFYIVTRKGKIAVREALQNSNRENSF